MDPSSANYPKDNHAKNKRAAWKMAEEKSVERQSVTLRREKEPYNTLNRTNNTVQELSEKWPKGRKETL